ncbi:MAG: hypothetical protein AW11_03412 [Candidatus Accumulibacter regalis]|uniref:Uncharacterized protein n=1 Tax=Accumulibacter regalis TaxID=522306 RepID=A0A011R335_ACCRE|nr:MAG: hypothetical protein AW11_03412 [Candidatus Accumulibacter regalis]
MARCHGLHLQVPERFSDRLQPAARYGDRFGLDVAGGDLVEVLQAPVVKGVGGVMDGMHQAPLGNLAGDRKERLGNLGDGDVERDAADADLSGLR